MAFGLRNATCALSSELQSGRGRLVILRLRNGDEAAGCGLDGAIQGGAGDLANVSKRRQLGVARS
jgi:hypothetical protein